MLKIYRNGNTRNVILAWFALMSMAVAQVKPRARDLGIPFDGTPGVLNAITDVKGVEVGHRTLISGDGPLKVGVGPVRTGVTAILPRGKESNDPVFAAWFTAVSYTHLRAHETRHDLVC